MIVEALSEAAAKNNLAAAESARAQAILANLALNGGEVDWENIQNKPSLLTEEETRELITCSMAEVKPQTNQGLTVDSEGKLNVRIGQYGGLGFSSGVNGNLGIKTRDGITDLLENVGLCTYGACYYNALNIDVNGIYFDPRQLFCFCTMQGEITSWALCNSYLTLANGGSSGGVPSVGGYPMVSVCAIQNSIACTRAFFGTYCACNVPERNDINGAYLSATNGNGANYIGFGVEAGKSVTSGNYVRFFNTGNDITINGTTFCSLMTSLNNADDADIRAFDWKSGTGGVAQRDGVPIVDINYYNDDTSNSFCSAVILGATDYILSVNDALVMGKSTAMAVEHSTGDAMRYGTLAVHIDNYTTEPFLYANFCTVNNHTCSASISMCRFVDLLKAIDNGKLDSFMY